MNSKQETIENETIEPGDILLRSGGYVQTNVRFYVVTRVSAHSVWFKCIEHETTDEGHMQGHSAPVEPMNVVGKERRKKLSFYKGRFWSQFGNFANSDSLTKWNGKPAFTSWYY